MTTNRRCFLVTLLIACLAAQAARADESVSSPDGNVRVSLRLVDDVPVYDVGFGDRRLIEPSRLGLEFGGKAPTAYREIKRSTSTHDETWKPVWGKRAVVRDHYNELVVELQQQGAGPGRVDLVVRAYDDGAAFRYVLPESGDAVTVTADLSEFRFAGGFTFWSYNREQHNRGPESIASAGNAIGLPMTMRVADDLYLAVLEAAIYDFSWMGLKAEGGSRVCHAQVKPSKQQLPGKTPWRVVMIGRTPGQLVDSDLLENLNPPCAIEDTSWIKPGIAFWDWRAWGHQADGFTYGLDTASWHRFIDLASESGVSYLLLDADWYGTEFSKESNPLTSKPGTDIPELIRYAREKNVGIALYLNDVAGWEYGLERIIRSFSEWGAAGLKYGFMRRVDGQAKVNRTREIVRLCAKYKLLVDFHDGPIPPSGDTRTWPNLITREYCHAQADAKRSFFPKTFTTTVFVNMLAGPLDMDNGMFDLNRSKAQRPKVFAEIPSTMVAEAARTLIVFSGLTVVPDSADSYRKHDKLFEFITAQKMPWQQSRTLAGDIGQFITMMRQTSDDVFLVASATNEEARTLSIPLEFLGEGEYEATLYEDAPDAHYLDKREAYRIRKMKVTRETVITAELAPGGGHCIRLVKVADSPDPLGVFAKDNLVAWCVVPFDAQKRGPAERAEMLARLGFTRLAYDWRGEHVPTFEQEILELKKRDIEMFAFWGEHDAMFRLFEKHEITPQVWTTLGSPGQGTQAEKVEAAARGMLPLVERTRGLGCKLGLYNHGGWGGEPENLVAVCRRLRDEADAEHVGIVYNLHHGHGHVDDFAEVLALMKPCLLCLNLNGMNDDANPKILPIGRGRHDKRLLTIIANSGYRGPVGILDHRNSVDAEQSLRENLDGLAELLTEL